MAAKTALNATDLEALGAERLAALLIEIRDGSALAKRRLRLELAGAQNPAAVGRKSANASMPLAARNPISTGRSTRRSSLTSRNRAAPSSTRSQEPMLSNRPGRCSVPIHGHSD
jgi:hypothetical protein